MSFAYTYLALVVLQVVLRYIQQNDSRHLSMKNYQANKDRYNHSQYKRSGESGLRLPFVSLGLWHNFGAQNNLDISRDMLLRAFDLGITHFDLANNYGPPPGSAESFFGQVLNNQLKPYRDELIISTKAGYAMWDGPYGDWGSRKYLIASLNQSLKRMKVDYVDIFYHHRPDPNTPLNETMQALSDIVKSGKALYVGLSNYDGERLLKASEILAGLGTPCVIHQPRLNMLDREMEHKKVLSAAKQAGIGTVPFSPLAQGMLSNKYLNGIPADSRANHPDGFLTADQITQSKLNIIIKLNEFAKARQQTLPQLAISWLHAKESVTSCIIGASKVSQIEELMSAEKHTPMTANEMKDIDLILQA